MCTCVCLHTHTLTYCTVQRNVHVCALLPINIRQQSCLTTTATATAYRLRSIYEWPDPPRRSLFVPTCIAIYSRVSRRIACRLGVLGVFHLEFTSSRWLAAYGQWICLAEQVCIELVKSIRRYLPLELPMQLFYVFHAATQLLNACLRYR